MDHEPFIAPHGNNKGSVYQGTASSDSELDSTSTPVLPLNNSDIKNSTAAMDPKARQAMNPVEPQLLQMLVVANHSAYTDVKISAQQENIDPHVKQNQEDDSDTEKPQDEIEQKNSMLLNYLDGMKRRRLELHALKPRPAWALMPVARIHRTSYATDEESKRIGNVLDDFFNCSIPLIPSRETCQDTLNQHKIKDEDMLVDVSHLKGCPPFNTKFLSSGPSSQLVPEVPGFKHTAISLMMEDFAQGLEACDPGVSTTSEHTGQAQQPVSLLCLNEKLRKEIWTLALQRPRIIELTSSTTHSILSRAAIPALLHTCRESRAIAKEHYALSFSTDGTSPKAYFDFKHDWVYTRCSGCLGTSCKHKLTLTDDHKKLKHLVFEGPMAFNPFPKILRFYPNVENLILIGGRSVVERDRINKEDISFIDESFTWAREEGMMALAKKAWIDIEPSSEKPLLLKHIWRATLPGVIDDVKRTSDATKGVWTCCC